MPGTELARTIDAVWRIESARIVAPVARIVRDVGLAEELAQDALVAAMEQWPQAGLPENPARLADDRRRATRRWTALRQTALSSAGSRNSADAEGATSITRRPRRMSPSRP